MRENCLIQALVLNISTFSLLRPLTSSGLISTHPSGIVLAAMLRTAIYASFRIPRDFRIGSPPEPQDDQRGPNRDPVGKKPSEIELYVSLFMRHFLRVGFPLVSMLLLLAMFSSQNTHSPSFMPVVTLDTSRVDMFNGVYGMLERLYADDHSSAVTVDSVTSSSVLLITDLATSLLDSIPYKVASTFRRSCFTYNNANVTVVGLTVNTGPQLNEVGKATNFTVTCADSHLFDYRALLGDWGYSNMLALSDTGQTVDQNYDFYQESIDRKSHTLNTVPGMLTFVLVAQFLTLGLTACHIYLERLDKRDSRLRPLGHMLSVWTLTTYIVTFVACLTMTLTMQSIQSMVSHDYTAFGVKTSLGSAYFGCLWSLFALSFFAMAAWVGPMWCMAEWKRPRLEDDDEDNENYELERFDTTLDEGDYDFKQPALERAHVVEDILYPQGRRDKMNWKAVI